VKHTHGINCLDVKEGFPYCKESGALLSGIWKLPYIKVNRQVTCPHGLKVFLVDGTYVRNNIDSDFVTGSGHNFPGISKKEIWIDRAMPKKERQIFIANECRQAEIIRSGGSLTKAYESAKRAEDHTRKLLR
jgi:hypothetical protein